MSAKPDMGQKLFVQLSMQYNQVKQSNSGCQRMLENFENFRNSPPPKKKEKKKKEGHKVDLYMVKLTQKMHNI